jgi:CubicO group peptidase (beta-lactamase class C family)
VQTGKKSCSFKNSKIMKKIFLLIPLLIGCSSTQEKSEYDNLLEFEGNYEYVNKTTLDIIASEFDTTLYAVIDNAKYPLKHIALDSFANIADIPVVFERDKSNRIKGYKTDGQVFKLITSDIKKPEMFPRKELFHNPANYVYHKPKKTTDGLETGSLADEFKNPEPIIDMVKETIKGKFPDVHSILIYKNNKLVLEEYFYGYDENTPHQLRSATKPFIGGILGIAVDKGFIKSEKEKLLPYFNSRYPETVNLDERKKEITIENFLMYRHGLDCDNNNPDSKGNEELMMQSEDWVKYTLDLPMVAESGKSSSYCTGCALTLGSLVEITTSKNIEEFAKENLFEPLGISNYEWSFEPNQAGMITFSQMNIRPRDLIKMAKLFKDGGKWKGKQIISESWINKTFDMEEGDYGYLWEHKYFVINGQKYNSYLASGNGGQKINIWPELDMITVFTGGNYNSYALYGKSTPPNEMIPNYILKTGEKPARSRAAHPKPVGSG